jgi:hypothetical protein
LALRLGQVREGANHGTGRNGFFDLSVDEPNQRVGDFLLIQGRVVLLGEMK